MPPPARTPRSVPQSKPKPQFRIRRSHQQFVGRRMCLGCGRVPTDDEPNECAHVRMGTDGGMGIKPSDRYTVPLCKWCHRLGPKSQHQIGEPAFWGRLGIDPTDPALRLWTVSGDEDKGDAVVFKARQRIELYQTTHGIAP